MLTEREGDNYINKGDNNHDSVEHKPRSSDKPLPAKEIELSVAVYQEYQQAYNLNSLCYSTARFWPVPSDISEPVVRRQTHGAGVLKERQHEVDEDDKAQKPTHGAGVVDAIDLKGGGVYLVMDGPMVDAIFDEDGALDNGGFAGVHRQWKVVDIEERATIGC